VTDATPRAATPGPETPGPAVPRPGAPDGLAAALAALYARVDAVVAAANPRCELSGRCCDFPNSGQRLYATDVESAYAVARTGGVPGGVSAGTCAWYRDGLCRNREGRPLGCRLYFCDPTWEGAMSEHYERFHAELRALHERHGADYRYRLFVEAVAERAP
jgi:Fe-S-cluster containining protein